MSLKQVLVGVRDKLDTLAVPVYMRDDLQAEGDGQYNVPDDDQQLLLDLVADSATYDFSSVYDTVVLQIGAWTRFVGDSIDLQERVRDLLENLTADPWECTEIVTTSEGNWRGCLATYRRDLAY
jgi:hypothetical protein